MTIHREGITSLVITAAVLFALNGVVFYLWPAWKLLHYTSVIASVVFFLLILQFFRNPKVTATVDERHVLAPADGKVVVIEEVTESEYLQQPCRQISIFMSPINVHVNRNPVSGVVEYFKYHAGKYLVAWHPKSSTENERTTIVVKTGSGKKVLMRQIAGAMAKRIKWYVAVGEQVVQGNEFGFIKFGSRVDVLLPLDAEVKVQLNQKTKAGRTIIAELKG